MRRWLALLLAGALALALAGCSGEQAPPSTGPSPGPSDSQEPQAQPFALAYDPQASLHPITSGSQMNLDLAGLVYEGLYELDRTFEPQPALAQSAVVSADGLTWTITLRPGACFSDGTGVTAQQVVQALNTARSSTLYSGRLSGIAGVTEVEGGVAITLSSPNGALPALLDVPIVLEQEGGIPLGTGRYRYVQEEDGLSLARNEYYQGQLPFDTIPLRGVATTDARIAAFDSGDVTAVVTDFSASYSLGYSGNYEACDFPTTTLLYVGFRVSGGLCASAQVRQAFSKAFDRESLVRTLLAGHGDAASLPISPLHQDYDDQAAACLDYDPTGSQELLLAWGGARGEDGLLYRNGAPVQATILVNNDSANKQAVAEYLAQCLEQLGVSVQVNALPWEEFLEALEAGRFDLYVGETRMTGDFDPTAVLAGGLNYGGFSDGTLSGLAAQWKAARGADRRSAAAQLWQAFSQQAPVAPLCFKRGSMLIRWGMVTNVQPTQADPYWNMEQWETAGG